MSARLMPLRGKNIRFGGTVDAFRSGARSSARLWYTAVVPHAATRCAVVVALAVIEGAGVVTGCGAFGTAGDVAAIDAAAPEGAVADAASVDGTAVTVTDAGRACVAPNCTNFETGELPATWTPVGDTSAIGVTVGATTSGSFALDLMFQSKEAFLAIDVANKTKVTVKANIKVLQFGDGEVDLFGISESSAVKTPGFHLVHAAAALSSLVVELGAGGAQPKLKSTFAGYTSVMFQYQPGTNTYSYRVGSEALQMGVLGGAVPAGTMTVTIGASFVSGPVTVPWHVRYDDVEITTTP